MAKTSQQSTSDTTLIHASNELLAILEAENPGVPSEEILRRAISSYRFFTDQEKEGHAILIYHRISGWKGEVHMSQF